MKKLKLTILFVVTLPMLCSADTLPVPAFLRDGKIEVTLRGGQKFQYSSNEYACVRRSASPKPEAAPTKVVVREISKVDDRPNRVTVHGGIGNTGLSVARLPGVTIVTQDKGVLFGGTYSRKLSERYSISGSAFSNDTYTLGIGYDF